MAKTTMAWTLPTESLLKLAGRLTAALLVYAVLRNAGFYNFTAREAEGLSVLIQLVGDIYAVLLAFTIFVIWGQFTEVENCVMRECNSLDDVLRFSGYLSADAHADIRRAVASYANHVVRSEWPTLGDGRVDSQADAVFSKFLNSVVEAAPRKDVEQPMHARLIDMAQKTGECRDERVAKSLTRIPPTLAGLVDTIAGVLLLLIFVYPFQFWYTGACCFALVALVLFLADFVMMDTDNPLKGVWNVSPQPFSNLKL
jgi:hypothetical protein